MNVLEWIWVFFSLGLLVLGLALLLGMIPAQWKARIKRTDHGTFLLKLIGISVFVYGLEQILNIMATRRGWASPDTNGIIGISIMTLCFLTLGLAYLSGMVPGATDTGQDKGLHVLMGIIWATLSFVFFFDAMGHKMSVEWMETAALYMKIAAIPLLLVAVALRSDKSARSSENE